jgi:hypothetical protein
MSHLSTSIRVACLFGFVAAVAVLSGCTRPTGTITGKIAYKGNPIKGGTVSFQSTESADVKYGGYINEDGTYTVPLITAGSYKIIVETNTMKPKGQKTGYGGKSTAAKAPDNTPVNKELPTEIKEKVHEGYHPSNPAEARANQNAARYVEIPATYSNADTTKLTYTATGGSQTYDINLD